MEKLRFNTYLEIDVTRKCNLNCVHCYKGDPQDFTISEQTIDDLLDQIEYVNNFDFAGGECFLVPDRLDYILEGLKSRQIKIDQFHWYTNGTIESDEICKLYRKYSDYVTYPEKSTIIFSIDKFHDREKSEKAMNYYAKNGCKTSKIDVMMIVKMGNALENIELLSKEDTPLVSPPPFFRRIKQRSNYIGSSIAVMTSGKFFAREFLSYDLEDLGSYAIGSVDNSIKDQIIDWNHSEHIKRADRMQKLCIKQTETLEIYESNKMSIKIFPFKARSYIRMLYKLVNDLEEAWRQFEPYIFDQNERDIYEPQLTFLEQREEVDKAYKTFFDENEKPI